MEHRVRFKDQTKVEHKANESIITFAPDTLRKPVVFSGSLNESLAFREAFAVLAEVSTMNHHLVRPRCVSELAFWYKSRDSEVMAEYLAKHEDGGAHKQMRQDLRALRYNSFNRIRNFYKAKRHYLDYLIHKRYGAALIAYPLLTVGTDELFIECLSQDETVYTRLSCDYSAFDNVREIVKGTTHVDFELGVKKEFEKIRDYKNTTLRIDPDAWKNSDEEENTREMAWGIPDGWVRSLLQISSAMTRNMSRFRLQAMDLYNVCDQLRRQRSKHAPSALRFELTPMEPVTIVLEPWEIKIKCPRSVYTGQNKHQYRMWNRRGLLLLEKLIPIADDFSVYIGGTGEPVFFVAHMGPISLTFALTGWHAEQWGRQGMVDLMSRENDVDEFMQMRVLKALNKTGVDTIKSLARQLEQNASVIASALRVQTQSGNVLYDLDKNVYRVRELFSTTLTADEYKYTNELERKAYALADGKQVEIDDTRQQDGFLHVLGSVHDLAITYQPDLIIDSDQQLIDASCYCQQYMEHKLKNGPCEHMLALRIQMSRENVNASVPVTDIGQETGRSVES